MAAKDEPSLMWPFKGGTWKERLLAVAFFFDFLIIWAGLYALAWLLAPFF